MALEVGDVVVVAPLAATTPLWALAYGVLFFRKEKLVTHHVYMVLLVVVGAVLIATR